MDEGTFAALYDALKRPLFAMACASLSPHEARDVVHDTFEVVWRKRHRAPENEEDCRRWCFGIARNKIRKEFERRSRKHHDSRFAEDFRSAQSAPLTDDIADGVADSDHARVVWEALQPSEKALLAVSIATDGSTLDISAALGITYSATTTRMSRLRKRLAILERSTLDGEEEVRRL